MKVRPIALTAPFWASMTNLAPVPKSNQDAYKGIKHHKKKKGRKK